ncbi:MAG: Ig-like domain-containing protein [Candidatus Bathyarchaeia archaeon]
MNASPTVSIAPDGLGPINPVNMDAGQIQAFTATVNGGTGTLSYQWYLDGNPVGTNSAHYSYTASGTSHSIYCTVTDSASPPVASPDSNTVTINVNAAMTVSITPAGPLSMDLNQIQTFTATPGGGSGSWAYQWFLDGNPVGSGTNSYSYTASGTSHSIYCEVFDVGISNLVAISSNNVAITVGVAPTVSVHAPSGFINNDDPTIQVSVSDIGGSGVTGVTVSINGGAAQTATYNSISGYWEYAASNLNDGSYSVTATVTDAAGNSVTSSPATFTVVTNPPSITAPIGISVAANTLGGANNVVLGTPSVSDIVWSASSLVITNNAPTSGLYPLGTTTVTWTVTDPLGNFATATQVVTVTDVAPTIIAPSDVSVPVNALGGANVVLGSPVIGSIAY